MTNIEVTPADLLDLYDLLADNKHLTSLRASIRRQLRIVLLQTKQVPASELLISELNPKKTDHAAAAARWLDVQKKKIGELQRQCESIAEFQSILTDDNNEIPVDVNDYPKRKKGPPPFHMPKPKNKHRKR